MARRTLLVTLVSLVLFSLFATPPALADPGDLDPNWSADGRQETSFGTEDDGANSIAIQSDQRVIAVGGTNAFFGANSAEAARSDGRVRSSGNGPSCDWAIVRYREDGVLDNTYGPNGNGKVRFGTEDCDVLNDVAIDANGNAVVAGFLGNDVGVARYDPDGTLDATFNPDGTPPGTARFDFGESNEQATAVAIDPSGRILLSGFSSAFVFGGSTGFVARLTSTGDLDPTFNAAGPTPGVYFFEEAFPEDETRAFDLVRQPNGSIVAVGVIRPFENCAQGECGGEAWLVVRLTDAGVLDGTFNPGGSPPGTRLLFAFRAGALAKTVALQGNKIVVAGWLRESTDVQGPPENEFFAPVVRLTATGQNDQTFANGGTKFIDAGPDGEDLNDVLVQPDRKIVIVGTEREFTAGPPEETDMLVVRLTRDSGAYDSTYHGDGRVTVDFGRFDGANHGALKLDGNLLTAGFAATFSDNGLEDKDYANMAVARLYGDPKGLDCTVSGTPGNDVLSGSAGPDVICGGAGNDTLKGFKGNDILRGGQGNDTIEGGLGADYLLGYAGNDKLNAADGAGGDVLEGDSGTDTCTTDAGDIVINC